MTDLFCAVAGFDPRVVAAAIPPSVRRDLEAAPPPRRDGDDVLVDLGPWTPRAPARHLLPSLALLSAQPPSVRFEVCVHRGGAWSPWITTMTLGDDAFPLLPASADGVSADIDEIAATPPAAALRLRVRVRGADAQAMLDAPWLVTLSAWSGEISRAAVPTSAHLAVPPRTQMTEPESVRVRICSPVSVGMALESLGSPVPTLRLADEMFHVPTDRYGVWPAAIRAAGMHGHLGYLLRFPDWQTIAWCLDHGLPVVISVRYGPGELTGAAIPETTGHLIVITGLERDAVLVNDPAAATLGEVPRRYDRSELTRAWLERAGVGYVFLPRV